MWFSIFSWPSERNQIYSNECSRIFKRFSYILLTFRILLPLFIYSDKSFKWKWIIWFHTGNITAIPFSSTNRHARDFEFVISVVFLALNGIIECISNGIKAWVKQIRHNLLRKYSIARNRGKVNRSWINGMSPV